MKLLITPMVFDGFGSLKEYNLSFIKYEDIVQHQVMVRLITVELLV